MYIDVGEMLVASWMVDGGKDVDDEEEGGLVKCDWRWMSA